MKKKIIGLFLILGIGATAFAQEYVSPTYKEWVAKSATYMEQNQLDSAEYALNQAIMSDPKNKNNPWLMTSLGSIQQLLGKYDAAYISLTAALNKSHESAFILHQRADLLIDMENNHLGIITKINNNENYICTNMDAVPNKEDILFAEYMAAIEKGYRE